MPPAVPARSPRLPAAAGPLSEAVLDALRQPPWKVRDLPRPPAAGPSPLEDDDLQLALYVLYEVHYRGFAGADETWEWHPGALALRADLEDVFEQALFDRVGVPAAAEPSDMDLQLRAVLEADDGPSLSRYLESQATLAQFREFVVHRSAYQLKEADPHSWAIPRLSGPPKAALLEVQFDEYGEGRPDAMHSTLFANTMAALNLDPTYGEYVGMLPGVTLATVNLMSLFGLHRRWRGAILGHLAAFEMSSSLANRRYSNALLRLGFGADARTFYDVHVIADAVHENLAAVDVAGGLARQEPARAADVLFGARALVALDAAFARHLLRCWEHGGRSLREGDLAGV